MRIVGGARLALLLALLSEALGASVPVAMAKWTLRVVDKTGAPVEGALARGGGWIPGAIGGTTRWPKARTDRDGTVMLGIKTAEDAAADITKAGYYRSEYRHRFAHQADPAIVRGRWQPWHRT